MLSAVKLVVLVTLLAFVDSREVRMHEAEVIEMEKQMIQEELELEAKRLLEQAEARAVELQKEAEAEKPE